MKRLIVDCLSGQIRAVIVDNDRVEEIIIEDKNKKVAAGGIYSGRVERVLKDGFAFVNIGDEKNAFLQLNKSNSLKQGDSIVVQVVKEAYDQKGANVVETLSFSGKYFVLTTENKPVGISAKIRNNERREELLSLVNRNLPKEYSGVVRTNSENTDNSLIINEIKNLLIMAEKIKQQGKFALPPYELLKGMGEVEKIVRDYLDNEDLIIVNSSEIFDNLKLQFPDATIELYTGNVPIFSFYMVESQIEKAMHKRVWLKSGGFLIIEPTEAMTVIDVNTGKFTGKNRNETILKTNLEAVEEIAHQLRLRNLSGMIIVDFINMENKESMEKLYFSLKEAIKRDRIKTVVVGETELGLMQLTRQKIHKPLHSILKAECPYCNGIGLVDSSEYLISKIKNHIQTIFTQTVYKKVVIQTDEKNIKLLKRDGFTKEFFKLYDGVIEFEVISTLRPDYYEVKYM